MKQIFIIAIAVCIIACNNAEKTTPGETKAASETKPASISNMSGYTPTYSASFEPGDAKNAEAILALWKAWDEGNLEPTKQLFADSVSFYFSDGSEMKGKRDSTTASAQVYRNMFSAVKSTVHAIFPIKSADKNEDWVCIWGTEVRTDKKGKIDSMQLQETWRFNSAGKVDLLYQYNQLAKPQTAAK
jgi:hypothetical protein